MTKHKSTKHALLMSALSLLLCLSMLVGSTFAWFTDSVTSSGNIIKSGTLDVTMEWKDATATGAQQSYKDASEGAIFNYDKWEPGYVEAKNIKIGNAGTLALKYQLSIIATGEVSKLADVIDVYYAEGEYTLTDRNLTTQLTHIGTLTQVLAAISSTASGDLLATETDTVTIALKMQESANNDYQGLSIGSEFAVQLLATQLTYEKDSFDDQYDKMATIDDVDELMAALAEKNVEIAFGSDIVLEEPITIAADQKVKFDLNGHKLSGVSTAAGTSTYMIEVDGELTVKNGTVTTQHTGADLAWSYCTAVFHMDFDGKLNIEDATVENLGGTSMAYAIDITNVYADDDSKLTVNNSVLKSTYIPVRVFNNGSGVHNVEIANSKLAGKFAFWVQYYADGDFKDAAEAELRRGNLNIDIYNNNNTFIGAEDKVSPILYGYDEYTYFNEAGMMVVDNADALADALAAGGDVIYTGAELDVDETLTVTGSLTINNATIDADAAGEIVVDGGTLTLGKGAVLSVDGEMPTAGVIRVIDDSEIVLDGAEIKGCDNKGTGVLINVAAGAKMTIEDGTVISDNTVAGSGNTPYALIKVCGELTMNGGEIINNEFAHRALISIEGGKFVMNDGTIANNTFTGTGATSVFYFFTGTAKFEMNGGTITGNDLGSNSSSAVFNTSSVNAADVLVVNGGTVNANKFAYVRGLNSLSISSAADVSGSVYAFWDGVTKDVNEIKN